jgi:hypothetical protein
LETKRKGDGRRWNRAVFDAKDGKLLSNIHVNDRRHKISMKFHNVYAANLNEAPINI